MNNSREEKEKIDILSKKAAGFFADLNTFNYDQDLIDFKKDIKDNLVMSGQEISDDVAAYLTFLTKYRKPKNILELGTFAGFSTLLIARACHGDFRITTIDVNKEPVDIGKRYWNKEGYADNINFIQGRALDILENIEEKFDFIFIDADKKGTLDYYNKAINLLDENGLILVDNIWLNGAVLDPYREMHHARIEFLKEIKNDNLNKIFLPVGDGLLLVSK